MWKLTGHPKTQKVTKAIAKQFADMEAAPGDRPLSERRLQVYEKIAKAGGFRPVSWAAATCKQTGGQYRVNGKHTATLFSGLEPLPELYAVVEFYECDTLEEVADLYSTYDSKTMTRTVSDINRSFARCVSALSDVPDRTVNTVVSAVAYSVHLDGYRRDLQPAERAEGILENYDFALWVHEMFGQAGGQNGNRHLLRVAVVAAMFGSYRKNKADAQKFWTEVRDETAPTPQEASRKLAKFLLLNHSSNSRKDQGTLRYRVSDREFFVKCIHAWNAWRKDEATNLAYHATADVPEFK